MKSLRTNHQGSSAIVALVLVLVVTVGGAVAFKVSQSHNNAASSTPVPTATDSVAPIKSKADLTNASKALDVAPIDSNMDPKQLDGELSDIL